MKARQTVTPASIHATHDGRFKDCREQPCADHRARYLKRWQYERSHGLLRLDTTEAARRHIDVLIGLGWSLRSIAGAAGISPSTVVKLRDGQRRAQRTVLAKVLDVDPEQVPFKASSQTSEPFVPKMGAVRRVQALIYMGWPHSEIGRRAGLRTNVLINQQGRWITRSSHDKIARVYNELAMTPGPSNRSRGWARRFGYLGPLAWDDIDTDPVPTTDAEPSEETDDVDDAAIYRRMHGDRTVELSIPEAQELCRRWTATGRSHAELERITGLNPDRYKEAS